MRIEYIFIRKNNDPVKVGDKIYTLAPSLKPFLKSLFKDVSDDSFKVKLKSKEYDVYYHHTTCKSEDSDAKSSMHYLTISIDGQRKDRCAEVLNSANQTILCTTGKKQYNIILAYDGVSKYYCDRAYPDLNEFERNIRNLVFRIVTKAFGTKWLDKTVTEETKDGLKASIQTRPRALRDERLIEEALYEMDIKALENYLFIPQRDISCNQVIDIALSPEKLKEMTKEQIEAELANARPKSLWERQFADKVSIDGLQEALPQIRALRNRVAHAKPFTYSDFTKCRRLLQEINPQIEQAICDISVKEYDLSETIRTIAGFGDAWTAAVSKTLELNKGISSVMSEIGSSIKDAYRVLDIMPMRQISEALKQVTDMSPVLSAVQSLPMAEIQKSWSTIHAALPSSAEIQAANQAAQMMQHVLPQYQALQQIAQMSNLISAVERPYLLANGLTHLAESEEEQPDKETDQPNQDKDALKEEKNSTDEPDGGTEVNQ
ncbi:hypothetical protein [Syntrophomonas wolfei]|jgi:hypothetical protein|uniref:hypothetical protein n=1 Tax=Syntrophomonas wolfei TaxID=863 RepID=UPI0023F2B197|nr:hypothetical protein [Syntrophomonas wolfei]